MNIADRLNRLRIKRGWEWKDLEAALGLSRTMLYYIRKSQQPIGEVELYKLAALERESGFAVTGFEAAALATSELIHEGEDILAERDLWMRRAKRAEGELEGLRTGLRQLLTASAPVELASAPEAIEVKSAKGRISYVSASTADKILDAASDAVHESGPGSPPTHPTAAPSGEAGKHRRGAGRQS